MDPISKERIPLPNLYDKLERQLTVVLEAKKPLKDRVYSLISGWTELAHQCRAYPGEQIFSMALCFRDQTLSIILCGQWDHIRIHYELQLETSIRQCGRELINITQKFEQHIAQLLQVLKNPWGNPILKNILERADIIITQREYVYFMRESPYMILTRLQQLYNDKCEDLALNLVTALMKCCDYSQNQIAGHKFSMTLDQTRFTFDVYIALLMKANRADEVRRELQELNIEQGYDLVMRFTHKRTDVSRLWRSAYEITVIAASTFCMKAALMPFKDVGESLAEIAKVWLQQCVDNNDLSRLQDCWLRMAPALLTAEHMYAFCDAITLQFAEKMRYFKLQLLIRAISTDINMLERLKVQNTWNTDLLKPRDTEEDKASNMVQEPDSELVLLPQEMIDVLINVTTSRIAAAFVRMADWVPRSPTLLRETLLTAFSVCPTAEILARIEESATMLGNAVVPCSTWTCHSHPPQSENGSNNDDGDLLCICSTTGQCYIPINIENALRCSVNPSLDVYELVGNENPGIEPDINNDVVVLIFAARSQPLSWNQRWSDLHRLCNMFLHKVVCLKNVTTALDYAKYDYDMKKLFEKNKLTLEQERIARRAELEMEGESFSMLPDDSSSDNGDNSDDEDWLEGPKRKKRKHARPRKLRDSSPDVSDGPPIAPSRSVPEQLKLIQNENSTKLLRTFRHNKHKRTATSQCEGSQQRNPETVFPFRDTFNTILSNAIDPADPNGMSKNGSHRSLSRSVRRTTTMSSYDNYTGMITRSKMLLLNRDVPYNLADIQINNIVPLQPPKVKRNRKPIETTTDRMSDENVLSNQSDNDTDIITIAGKKGVYYNIVDYIDLTEQSDENSTIDTVAEVEESTAEVASESGVLEKPHDTEVSDNVLAKSNAPNDGEESSSSSEDTDSNSQSESSSTRETDSEDDETSVEPEHVISEKPHGTEAPDNILPKCNVPNDAEESSSGPDDSDLTSESEENCTKEATAEVGESTTEVVSESGVFDKPHDAEFSDNVLPRCNVPNDAEESSSGSDDSDVTSGSEENSTKEAAAVVGESTTEVVSECWVLAQPHDAEEYGSGSDDSDLTSESEENSTKEAAAEVDASTTEVVSECWVLEKLHDAEVSDNVLPKHNVPNDAEESSSGSDDSDVTSGSEENSTKEAAAEVGESTTEVVSECWVLAKPHDAEESGSGSDDSDFTSESDENSTKEAAAAVGESTTQIASESWVLEQRSDAEESSSGSDDSDLNSESEENSTKEAAAEVGGSTTEVVSECWVLEKPHDAEFSDNVLPRFDLPNDADESSSGSDESDLTSQSESNMTRNTYVEYPHNFSYNISSTTESMHHTALETSIDIMSPYPDRSHTPIIIDTSSSGANSLSDYTGVTRHDAQFSENSSGHEEALVPASQNMNQSDSHNNSANVDEENQAASDTINDLMSPHPDRNHTPFNIDTSSSSGSNSLSSYTGVTRHDAEFSDYSNCAHEEAPREETIPPAGEEESRINFNSSESSALPLAQVVQTSHLADENGDDHVDDDNSDDGQPSCKRRRMTNSTTSGQTSPAISTEDSLDEFTNAADEDDDVIFLGTMPHEEYLDGIIEIPDFPRILRNLEQMAREKNNRVILINDDKSTSDDAENKIAGNRDTISEGATAQVSAQVTSEHVSSEPVNAEVLEPSCSEISSEAAVEHLSLETVNEQVSPNASNEQASSEAAIDQDSESASYQILTEGATEQVSSEAVNEPVSETANAQFSEAAASNGANYKRTALDSEDRAYSLYQQLMRAIEDSLDDFTDTPVHADEDDDVIFLGTMSEEEYLDGTIKTPDFKSILEVYRQRDSCHISDHASSRPSESLGAHVSSRGATEQDSSEGATKQVSSEVANETDSLMVANEPDSESADAQVSSQCATKQVSSEGATKQVSSEVANETDSLVAANEPDSESADAQVSSECATKQVSSEGATKQVSSEVANETDSLVAANEPDSESADAQVSSECAIKQVSSEVANEQDSIEVANEQDLLESANSQVSSEGAMEQVQSEVANEPDSLEVDNYQHHWSARTYVLSEAANEPDSRGSADEQVSLDAADEPVSETASDSSEVDSAQVTVTGSNGVNYESAAIDDEMSANNVHRQLVQATEDGHDEITNVLSDDDILVISSGSEDDLLDNGLIELPRFRSIAPVANAEEDDVIIISSDTENKIVSDQVSERATVQFSSKAAKKHYSEAASAPVSPGSVTEQVSSEASSDQVSEASNDQVSEASSSDEVSQTDSDQFSETDDSEISYVTCYQLLKSDNIDEIVSSEATLWPEHVVSEKPHDADESSSGSDDSDATSESEENSTNESTAEVGETTTDVVSESGVFDKPHDVECSDNVLPRYNVPNDADESSSGSDNSDRTSESDENSTKEATAEVGTPNVSEMTSAQISGTARAQVSSEAASAQALDVASTSTGNYRSALDNEEYADSVFRQLIPDYYTVADKMAALEVMAKYPRDNGRPAHFIRWLRNRINISMMENVSNQPVEIDARPTTPACIEIERRIGTFSMSDKFTALDIISEYAAHGIAPFPFAMWIRAVITSSLVECMHETLPNGTSSNIGRLTAPTTSRDMQIPCCSNATGRTINIAPANEESREDPTRNERSEDNVINIYEEIRGQDNEAGCVIVHLEDTDDSGSILSISSDSESGNNAGSVEVLSTSNAEIDLVDVDRSERSDEPSKKKYDRVQRILFNVPGMSSPYRERGSTPFSSNYQVYVVQLVGAHRTGAPAAPAAVAGGSNSPQAPQSTQQQQQTSTQVTPHIQRVGQPRAMMPTASSSPNPPVSPPAPTDSAPVVRATARTDKPPRAAAGTARCLSGGTRGSSTLTGGGGSSPGTISGHATISGVGHAEHNAKHDTTRATTIGRTITTTATTIVGRQSNTSTDHGYIVASNFGNVSKSCMPVSHVISPIINNQITRIVATAAATPTTSSTATTTTKRIAPLINIISSQQVAKPGGTVITPPVSLKTSNSISSNSNSTTVINDQQQLSIMSPQLITTNSFNNRTTCINPLTTIVTTANTQQHHHVNIKTVLAGDAGSPGGSRVMQIICKSADGRLIPVTSLANRVLKVTSAAPAGASSADSATAESAIGTSTLPKFNQVFGKSIYSTSPSGNSTVVQTQPITIKGSVQSLQGLQGLQGLQALQGGVIYTRQMPVGVGQTINIIGGTPQSRQVFRIAAAANNATGEQHISLVKDTVIHSKMSALLAAALQGQKTATTNANIIATTDQSTITANVIAVEQQQGTSAKVLVKPNVNLSSTTLEQLREFDMVYKQVTERSCTSTPADLANEASATTDQLVTTATLPATATVQLAAQSQRISLAYVNNQGNLKLNCAQLPLVVVNSYGNAGPPTGNIIAAANTKLVTAKVTKVSSGTGTANILTTKSIVMKTSTPPNTPPNVTQSPSQSPHASTSSQAVVVSASSLTKTSPIQPKPAAKPQEDEHTTQRIFDILAEYAEQLRNAPDLNNKPAPRRRSNPPTNPTTASAGSGSSKRKKTGSAAAGGKSGKASTSAGVPTLQGQQSSSSSNDVEMDDGRTVGSEDSNAGVGLTVNSPSVTETTNICAAATVPLPAAHITVSTTPQQIITTTTSSLMGTTVTTTSVPLPSRQQHQLIITDPTTNQTRNLIIADGTNAATAVLMPGNYLMPLTGMVKSGQQIALVNAVSGNKILATVPAGRNIQHPANMLLFQSLLNQLPTQSQQRKTVVTTSNNAGAGGTTTTVKYSLQPTPILTTTDTPELLLRIANRNPAQALSQPSEEESVEQVVVMNTGGTVATTSAALTPILPIATSVIQGQKDASAQFAMLNNKLTTGKVNAQIGTQQQLQHHTTATMPSIVRGVLNSIGRVTSVVVHPSNNNQTMATVITPHSAAISASVTTSLPSVVPTTSSSAAVSVSVIEQSSSQTKDLLRNGGSVAKQRIITTGPSLNSTTKSTPTYYQSSSSNLLKFRKLMTNAAEQQTSLQTLPLLQRRNAAAAAAVYERELRIQKSLSEECEDLGVDEPSASDLFPEAADLLVFDNNHSPTATSFDNLQIHHSTISSTPDPHAVKHSITKQDKLTLFGDDDFLFDSDEYQTSNQSQLQPHQPSYEDGGAVTNAAIVNGNDHTLLQTCASMSDVTMNSPISPEYPVDRYAVHKYSNRKKQQLSPAAVVSHSNTSTSTSGSSNSGEDTTSTEDPLDSMDDNSRFVVVVKRPSGHVVKRCCGRRKMRNRSCSSCNGVSIHEEDMEEITTVAEEELVTTPITPVSTITNITTASPQQQTNSRKRSLPALHAKRNTPLKKR